VSPLGCTLSVPASPATYTLSLHDALPISDVVLEHQIAPKPSGYGHQQGAQQGQIQTAAMNGGHRVIQTRQPIDERYRQQHDCHHEMAPAGRAVPDSPNDQEFQCAYDAG